MQNRSSDKLYCGVRRDVIITAMPVLNKNIVGLLYEFIRDRTEVYYNKEILKNPAPWTENPILREVKFTNVRREWDRQSRNLIKYICEADEDLKTRCFNIILFRLWNKLESWSMLEEGKLLQFPLAQEKFDEYYELIKLTDNHTWYSAAYNTSPVRNCHRTQLDRTHEKVPFYPASPLWFAKWYLNDDLWNQIIAAEDQFELFKVLQQFPFMGGPFLAYQLFVDFTYNKDFWFSENEFTVSGPGCSRGLDLLFDDRDGMTHEECLFWLRDNQLSVFREYGYDPNELFHFLPENERMINVMSFENLHCELSKYKKCADAIAAGEKPRGKVSFDGLQTKVKDKVKKGTSDLFDMFT